jgi:hypothetical protein
MVVCPKNGRTIQKELSSTSSRFSFYFSHYDILKNIILFLYGNESEVLFSLRRNIRYLLLYSGKNKKSI